MMTRCAVCWQIYDPEKVKHECPATQAFAAEADQAGQRWLHKAIALSPTWRLEVSRLLSQLGEAARDAKVVNDPLLGAVCVFYRVKAS